MLTWDDQLRCDRDHRCADQLQTHTVLVIPEKAVHIILERNPKVREALQERIRIHSRELQRQMKVAELRRRSTATS